jgi:hypothetical protein
MPQGGRHRRRDTTIMTTTAPQKKQQSTDDGVPFGCGEKWRGKQGRCVERRKTASGVQRSPSSHQQKLVGSLDNNDDEKYTTNKYQMMVVHNGWDGKGHSRK